MFNKNCKKEEESHGTSSKNNKKDRIIRNLLSFFGNVGKWIQSAARKINHLADEKLSVVFDFFTRLQSHGVLYTIGHSFLIYLIVEMLSRRSPIEGISYLFQEPAVFIYNWILVMATMSVALLIRKRQFAFLLISMVWLLLGVTNCVLLGFRTTPLNFMDFRTFKDVMGIINVYFSPIQLTAMIIGLAVFFLIMILLLIKTPSVKISYKKAGAVVVSFGLILGGATAFSLGNGTLITTFHNIQDAYKNYGFAYCFAASVVDRGISKPSDYSEESMQDVVDEVNEMAGDAASEQIVKSDSASEKTPNIIVLQLESFFDPKTLKNVTFSEDPVPVFTSLKENYSSGWLTTPSFGAGTANTEFEVNTGMSMEYFGPGEYPYTTILRETATESLANNLKDYGYATHAIHNHTGKFYGRYLVYPNLGFDSFTSVEYMQDVERNPLNWAEDQILTGEIQKVLNSTEQQDYVFAVSVQGHGKYPETQIDDTQTITSSGFNEEETVGFDYYLNQIHHMDEFLGELTESLSQSSEPTILVVYGDHLPKFSIDNDDVVNGNVYQTEYVIWDNFGMEKQDKDVTSYQLGARVMGMLDMHSGIITRLQQYGTESDHYYSILKELQYDLLYGKKYAADREYKRTDMEMGTDPITMTGVHVIGDNLYVTGENFTEASKIYFNGEMVSTEFLNSGRICCHYGKEIKDGDTIEVIQMSSRRTELSSAGMMEWHADGSVLIKEPVRNLSLEDVESDDSIQDDIDKEEGEI